MNGKLTVRRLGWSRSWHFAVFGLLTCSAAHSATKLAVLDLELTGDLGGPEFEQEHAARLRSQSLVLRKDIAATGLYEILDNAPAKEVLERLQSQHAYLFDCGCDLEFGKALGADQVLLTWVNRVSGLILTLTFEIHDVKSGQIVARKSYDFRGDNDSAWTHAINYMTRDLASMNKP